MVRIKMGPVVLAGKRGGSPHLSFRANPGSKPLKFRRVLGPFRDLFRADPEPTRGQTRGQNLGNQPGVGTGNSRKMRGPTSIARHDEDKTSSWFLLNCKRVILDGSNLRSVKDYRLRLKKDPSGVCTDLLNDPRDFHL